MARRWKQQETTYLKRYASKRTLAELAERFKTDEDTVKKKLDSLGLASKDAVVAKPDPLLKVYERGLKAMHGSKWKDAVKALRQVAEETEQPDLAQRARRYLVVCEQKLEKQSGSAQDPFLQAVYERNRGNLEEALAICARGGRQSKDERFAYLAASLHALNGDLDKAAGFLATAIELNPKNRIHAYHDSDFDELRGSPEHQGLFDAS